MNADFYEFRISNAPELAKKDIKSGSGNLSSELPDLESIE